MNSINLKIAFRNVIRQYKRSGIMIIIVALCTIIISFIGGLYQFLFVSVENNDIKSNGHIWIEGNFSFLEDDSLVSIIEKINGIEEIADYTYRGTFNGVVGYNEASSIFSGKLYDKEKEKAFSDEKSLKNQLGKTLAQNLGVNENSVINGFSSNRGFSFEVEKIIHTESEELDKYFIKIPFDYLTEEVTLKDISSFHFHVFDVKKIDDVNKNLRKIFVYNNPGNDLKIHNYTDSDSYTCSVRNIYQNNLYFIMIALAITILFSLLSLFSLIVYERLNEFGTIRTLGTPEKAIFLSMFFEASIIAITGFLAGVILTELIGAIINSLGGIKLPPPPTVETEIILDYVFTFKYIFLAFAEVFIISNLSAAFLSFTIVKKNIIQQLNGE